MICIMIFITVLPSRTGRADATPPTPPGIAGLSSNGPPKGRGDAITIVGLSIFGTAYAPAAVTSIAFFSSGKNSDAGLVALPVVGPLIVGITNDEMTKDAKAFFIVDGVVQALGLVTAVVGAATASRATRPPRLMVAPSAGSTGVGLFATGRF